MDPLYQRLFEFEEEQQAFIATAKGRNGQESPYTQVFENRDI